MPITHSLGRRADVLNSQELPIHLATSKVQTLQDPPHPRPPLQTTLRDLAWAPLGNFLATASSDKTVRIWNPERPVIRNTTELRDHTSACSNVEWNPVHDGQLASITDGSDHSLRLWDMRIGKSIRTVDTGRENGSLAWSPDGDTIAVGSKGSQTKFFDLRKSNASFVELNQDTQSYRLIWSHSGTALFIPKANGDVDLVDWPSLRTIYTIKAHNSACYCLSLDPLGQYLAIGGDDAVVSLWDTRDWMCRVAFGQNEGPIHTCSFSFDSSYVTTGTTEGLGVMIFHIESGQHIHTVRTSYPPSCVRWHPSRYVLAYLGDPIGVKLVGVPAD